MRGPLLKRSPLPQHDGRPSLDPRREFADFVAATVKRLKSQDVCSKGREIFFANVLPCLGAGSPEPPQLYRSYLATIGRENAKRMANGPYILKEVPRFQFYQTAKGLRELARSFSQSQRLAKAPSQRDADKERPVPSDFKLK